jgi:hypothetical protein
MVGNPRMQSSTFGGGKCVNQNQLLLAGTGKKTAIKITSDTTVAAGATTATISLSSRGILPVTLFFGAFLVPRFIHEAQRWSCAPPARELGAEWQGVCSGVGSSDWLQSDFIRCTAWQPPNLNGPTDITVNSAVPSLRPATAPPPTSSQDELCYLAQTLELARTMRCEPRPTVASLNLLPR